ncbi:unnamed protein product [Protopolystoma xenopodis]|uniref:Ig-like domain-containing protein n=1 Tax=Protopolystoma xenopodis TaxID=117903 RepID=A0A3S5AJH7_9PLAT|nr:unnamed protein product [Protopolystoma xenopodis]
MYSSWLETILCSIVLFQAYLEVPSEVPRLQQLSKEGFGAPIEVGPNVPAIVDDGDLLVLRCTAANGKPGARLSWYLDGVKLEATPSSGSDEMAGGSSAAGQALPTKLYLSLGIVGGGTVVSAFQASLSGHIITKVEASKLYRRL